MPRRATPIFRRCGSRRSRLRRACPAPCGAGGGNSAPGTPRLNGKVERSHRIDAEEFYRMLDGVVVDDAKLFTTKLQEWEDFYSFQRPHGALGGQTPYERLRSKTKDPGVSGHRQLHTCRPYRTRSEPRSPRKPPDMRLVDLLLGHYQELEPLME